ncbi:MAG: hypothetical protein KDD22_07615, partial [Bdellovibrionales bacterium]|nr:hypothetical protein [Bdellovibrionales bacterium]
MKSLRILISYLVALSIYGLVSCSKDKTPINPISVVGEKGDTSDTIEATQGPTELKIADDYALENALGELIKMDPQSGDRQSLRAYLVFLKNEEEIQNDENVDLKIESVCNSNGQALIHEWAGMLRSRIRLMELVPDSLLVESPKAGNQWSCELTVKASDPYQNQHIFNIHSVKLVLNSDGLDSTIRNNGVPQGTPSGMLPIILRETQLQTLSITSSNPEAQKMDMLCTDFSIPFQNSTGGFQEF